jgi:hypothetical protein
MEKADLLVCTVAVEWDTVVSETWCTSEAAKMFSVYVPMSCRI